MKMIFPEKIRHGLRYVVNGAALGAAVLALPELGPFLPATALPQVAAVVAVLNTVLSLLRRE